jgi:hypothetical protein
MGKESLLSTIFGSKKFQIETYYVVLDKFSVELDKRISAYSEVCNKFGFLTRIRDAADADYHHRFEEKEIENLKTCHHDVEPSVKGG